ncbi:MAG: iron ABC transporter permease [Candidatus Hydrogenedentes bacterium]|nr:iron ABC transporter permease [Candidatus Hydrogenedentota bacterium]
MKPRLTMKWGIALGLLGLCAVVPLSLFLGSTSVGWRDLMYAAMNPEAESERRTLFVLMQLRLPRTLAALLGGAGLALAGCVFQVLLRNPLATPYTLGVASASAFGAWMGLVVTDLGWFAGGVLGLPTVQVFAFAVALAEIAVIYSLARHRMRGAPMVLLLTGVTFGMLANAGIMLTRYLAKPDRLVSMNYWMMGGVDVVGFAPVVTLCLGVIPCAAVLMGCARQFDQIAFDEEMAESRGVPVVRLQLVGFFVASIMTAMVVSEIGPIGFVGLVVPHVVRMLVGPYHRALLPCTVLFGGVFLCACDVVARALFPGETPIGIMTTLVGGPFFLYLLMQKRYLQWGA